MIAIFTKFDDLVKQIYDKNLEMAENLWVALAALDAKFQVPLSKFKFKSLFVLEKCVQCIVLHLGMEVLLT